MPQGADTPRDIRRARFLRGVRLGLPIFLGYMPVGMAFGVIASTVGFSVVQATACSATALAGAGQFIALSVLRAGESALGVLIATTVVNLRYVLFGATLSPYLRGMTLPQQAMLAFTLTDETFAVNINDRREGRSTGMSMLGVGAIAWAGWVGGTLIGSTASAWVGDPSRWGVEFAMPAMFTALLIALAENRSHLVIAFVAGGLTLVLPLMGPLGLTVPPSSAVLISAMTAAVLGAVWARGSDATP